MSHSLEQSGRLYGPPNLVAALVVGLRMRQSILNVAPPTLRKVVNAVRRGEKWPAQREGR